MYEQIAVASPVTIIYDIANSVNIVQFFFLTYCDIICENRIRLFDKCSG
jgi:hypothetical protein